MPLNATLTDQIAWYAATVATYAAVVATLVFIFEIWKWTRHHARLRVRVRGRTHYPDGGFLDDNGRSDENGRTLTPYFHIEVTNTGELATTILAIQGTTKPTNWIERFRYRRKKIQGEMFFHGEGFIAHNGNCLPYVLSVGGVWSCRVAESNIKGLTQMGNPKVELVVASSSKPLYVTFPKTT